MPHINPHMMLNGSKTRQIIIWTTSVRDINLGMSFGTLTHSIMAYIGIHLGLVL